jgi:hypothetical protein
MSGPPTSSSPSHSLLRILDFAHVGPSPFTLSQLSQFSFCAQFRIVEALQFLLFCCQLPWAEKCFSQQSLPNFSMHRAVPLPKSRVIFRTELMKQWQLRMVSWNVSRV